MAIDIEHDLAILRLLPDPKKQRSKYPFIPLGRSNDLMVGETVIAMGGTLYGTVVFGAYAKLDQTLTQMAAYTADIFLAGIRANNEVDRPRKAT